MMIAGLFLYNYLNPSQLTLTAPFRVASDQQTSQWAFAAACGSRIGLGVPAASMFYEHLADADAAALKRLLVTSAFRWTSFRGIVSE